MRELQFGYEYNVRVVILVVHYLQFQTPIFTTYGIVSDYQTGL